MRKKREIHESELYEEKDKKQGEEQWEEPYKKIYVKRKEREMEA